MRNRSFEIRELHIEEHVLDKIESKHGVTLEEVHEACTSGSRHVRRVRQRRYMVLGRTARGRYLASFLTRAWPAEFWVISARDMNDEERRIYERHAKKGR